jgi:ABC-type Mn2+/Zn2+ transport system ATPase subunit
MTASKRILIIAGPNGAGKTVFATEFLPNEANCLHKRGPHSRRPESISTRPGRSSGRQADVEHDS